MNDVSALLSGHEDETSTEMGAIHRGSEGAEADVADWQCYLVSMLQ